MEPSKVKHIPVVDKDKSTPAHTHMSPPEEMEFYEAIKELRTGKKIKRIGWGKEEYGILRDGFVTIHKPDGKFYNWNVSKFYNWNVSDGDLDGKDWIIIN